MTRRQSRAAPTVPPAPRPQKRAAPATRESHKAKRSKSATRATVSNTDSRPPASEHPSQLVTVPIAGNDAAPAPVDIAAIVSEAVLAQAYSLKQPAYSLKLRRRQMVRTPLRLLLYRGQ